MIIGIAGPAGSGKTTAAACIAQRRAFYHTSFAEPIRQFVRELTGYSESTKELTIPWIGKSPRELMQSLGTEWGRELVSPSIWVESCRRRCVQHANAIISDVRFLNELELCDRLIFIDRPGVKAVADHISEQHAGSIRNRADVIVRNDCGSDEFLIRVLAAVDHLIGRER